MDRAQGVVQNVTDNSISLTELRELVSGTVLTAADDGYDAAWQPWAIGVVHHPAVIVVAESANDIAQAVRFAAKHGLPVGVQATGHGVSVPCDNGVLINTSRMVGVTIDPTARTARVKAGTQWRDVVSAAQDHGLAPLNGSSPLVGVVGYTLGGGSGWLARKYGYAADRVVSADIVTADGEALHVTAESHPDLFWAIRGGGSNFGVVTALEFGLVPVTDIYGGTVYYPMTEAHKVLNAYATWVTSVPDEMTSSVVLMRFPPLPDLPPIFRGQKLIGVRACYAGDPAEGERLLEPMRTLATPAIDLFKAMTYRDVAQVSMDPENPMPVRTWTQTLTEFSPDTIDALLSVVGPDVDCPMLLIELRHIEGALKAAPFEGSAANRHDVPFALYALGVSFSPEMSAGIQASCDQIRAALSHYSSDRVMLNFLGGEDHGPDRTRAAYSDDIYQRLAQIKAQYDPNNLFCVNHNIVPAS